MAMSGGTAKLVHSAVPPNWPDAIRLYVYYKTEADNGANQSKVTTGMYVTTPNYWDIGGWSDFYGSYVGREELTFNGEIPNFWGTRWLVENKSFMVDHNDDGTGSATIQWKWGVNSGASFGFVIPSGSFTIPLTTIPRASVPTVSASSARIGETVTISTNRKANYFTHTLKYTMGSLSGTIATEVGDSCKWTIPESLSAGISGAAGGVVTITCVTYNGANQVGTKTAAFTVTAAEATVPVVNAQEIAMGDTLTITMARKASSYTHNLTYKLGSASGTIGTGLGTSKKWTVPISLAAAIPSDKSGTVTITCVTMNGSAVIGTKTVDFTATVPDNDDTKPVAAMTLAPVSSLAALFAYLYIQGITSLRADFTASSAYSSITKYSISGSGISASGNPATSKIANAGTIAVTGRVTDGRGYYRDVEKRISVIPYSDPILAPYTGENKIVCRRCRSDGVYDTSGIYLRVRAKRVYAKVEASGEQKNFCSLRYRYMPAAGSFSAWTNLLPGSSLDSDLADMVLPGAVFDAAVSYIVQIGAVDDIGKQSIHTFEIPTASVALHLKPGGKGAAFGKYAEEDNLLDVNWDMRVRGRLFSANPMMYEAIPSGADLDDYINPGFYYSSSDSNTIANANGLHAFELVVTSISPYSTNCYCTQWLKSYKENAFYVRTQLNWNRPLSWKDWTKFGG